MKEWWVNKQVIYVGIFVFAIAAFASPVSAQSDKEREVLEAIRSGRLRVTPELIEAQKALHPELRKYSNAEIENRLRERIQADEAVLSETSVQSEAQGAPRTKDATANTPPAPAPPSGSDGEGRFPPALKRFGYDFFSNDLKAGLGGTTPSLPDYVLSPGDEIQVYTWGRENQSQVLVISPEGMIHYPPLQPMRVSGMRFSQTEALLRQEIQKIHGVQASIALGKLKSMRIMVLGEAVSPGSIVVPAGATVTTALFQSGGISDIGSLRSIQVRRHGGVIATLDLYDMLLRGNSKGDIQLLPNDAVFIPVAAIQVAVHGHVKRPAIYEVKTRTKALDALELAGGLSSNAFKGRVRLDRIESHKRKVVLDIGMEKMAGSSNPHLLDGDILFVESVLDKEDDVVYLEGNVNRPGRYEFKKGMTIRDLIPSQKDLKSETYFNYGHIKRRAEDDERALLIPFSLKDVFEKSAAVPLEPRDTVTIYSKYDVMDQPLVRISGKVRSPGSFRFVDRMRVSDLIIAGGGLMVEAYLPEAHLIRVLKSGESDSLYSTLMKVNLTGVIDNPGDENNLELKPFDSLLVFPRSNFVLPKKISIYGAVKQEGEYELTQNMGIRELISQAQGLTKNSYKLNVEIVRRQVVGDSLITREIRQISLKQLLEGKEAFALQDGDGVYIREVVNARERSSVWMMGEFNFPGRYEFANGERLSSVIRRAGEFKPEGYLRGAVFIRKSVKAQQLEHIQEIGRRLEHQLQLLMQRTHDEKERGAILVAVEQRKNILEETKNAPYLGRVVIKLNGKFAGSEYDIAVENGDSLWIGPSPATVSVFGEVYSPTNLIFARDANTVGECLGKSGGVNEYGDKGNTYYIQPDGTVQTPKNTNFFDAKKVEPGGSIIVPPKGPRKNYLDDLAKITQIIYQVAISVGVAKTVF